MSEFSDRYGPWAVITGAAQGVGLAFARSALERGVSVVLVDRDPAVIAAAAALPGDTRAVIADLTDPGWMTLVADTVGDLEVGLAVANAGIAYVGSFLEQSTESAGAIIDVACRATVTMAQWALPPMVRRGRGGFIVTSSGSALVGTGGVATYSASKAFGLNLAEAIGWELRDSGVDVAAVIAPSMDTPGYRASGVDRDASVSAAVDPQEVTDAALDALPVRGAIFGHPDLAAIETMTRRDLVDLMSSVTTSMYPDLFG